MIVPIFLSFKCFGPFGSLVTGNRLFSYNIILPLNQLRQQLKKKKGKTRFFNTVGFLKKIGYFSSLLTLLVFIRDF